MPTLVYYTSTNPCVCSHDVTPPPSPSLPSPCQCLVLCNIVVNATSDDAVGPCGAEGMLDITAPAYNHDTCACGENPLIWSIDSFDPDIFATVSIDSGTGVLTWITMGPDKAFPKQYGNIVVKLCCGQLSAYLHVTIGVKDLCNCTGAPPCDGCDPCTGLTLAQSLDIQIGAVTAGADISVIT